MGVEEALRMMASCQPETKEGLRELMDSFGTLSKAAIVQISIDTAISLGEIPEEMKKEAIKVMFDFENGVFYSLAAEMFEMGLK